MSELGPFNGVNAIKMFIATKKKTGLLIKEIKCPASINELKQTINFKFGEDVDTVFLLKEDIFVELGPPDHESVAFIAITRSSHELQDGLITVIGPDISDSAEKSLNFGQVILFEGRNLKDLEYREMERELFHLKNLEGFMIRAIPNKLWCRVSKDVGQRGFSFETLGKALMIMYKQRFPSIDRMEILFMTSESSRDFLELKVLGSEVRKPFIEQYSTQLKSRLTEIAEKKRDDCDNPWDCSECDFLQVCDEVRDIVDKMRAYRAQKTPP